MILLTFQKCVSLAAAGVILLAMSCLAEAQQKNIPRIGYLATVSSSTIRDRYEAFQQGLRDHGYSVGTNVILESRFAGALRSRLPAIYPASQYVEDGGLMSMA